MLAEGESIGTAMELRSRYMRGLQAGRTAADRLAEWAELQEASFRLLCASPDGYHHFLTRNLTSRRTEVIDGHWRPVSPARRAQQP